MSGLPRKTASVGGVGTCIHSFQHQQGLWRTCPSLAFSHTKVSYGLASSGGNSLMSSTWTVTATRLVRTGLSAETRTGGLQHWHRVGKSRTALSEPKFPGYFSSRETEEQPIRRPLWTNTDFQQKPPKQHQNLLDGKWEWHKGKMLIRTPSIHSWGGAVWTPPEWDYFGFCAACCVAGATMQGSLFFVWR